MTAAVLLDVVGRPPQTTGGGAMATVAAPPVSSQLREMDRRRLGEIALRALDGRPLPHRPSGGERVPDVDWRWRPRARCDGAPAADGEAMTDAETQGAGRPLADQYCGTCPVVLPCLTAGRATRATGVWGGTTLADGKLAPDRHRGTGRRGHGTAPSVTRRPDRNIRTPPEPRRVRTATRPSVIPS
jgi:hypothetical protein